jgi:hypothetical protein
MDRFLRPRKTILDSAIEVADPRVAEELRKMHVNSIHFAMRWQMLLFADEHDFPDIWCIWDAIIAHRANASAFVNQLSITHILQVPLKESWNVIEALQNHRRWDVPKLIRTAEERLALSRKRRFKRKEVVITLLVLLVFSGSLVVYNKEKSRLNNSKPSDQSGSRTAVTSLYPRREWVCEPRIYSLRIKKNSRHPLAHRFCLTC